MITLEVACGNLESVRAAEAGGADRIELCAALGEGGLTPSAGFIEAAVAVTRLPVFVMVRPRQGDFLYSDDEFHSMLSDIRHARSMGVHGFVTGMLLPDGRIDSDRCTVLIKEAGGLPVTFHRAFDLAKDAVPALEELIRCGFSRLLTSGQAPSALQGLSVIRDLVEQSNGRIQIMAGAGVHAGNVADIIQHGQVKEIHLSGKSESASRMQFRRNGLSMGGGDATEYSWSVTDPEQIRQVRVKCDHAANA